MCERTLRVSRRAQIQANIDDLNRKIALAREKLDALDGKTVTTYITTVSTPGTTRRAATGGIIGAAAGGGPRGPLVMVGEHGRELVALPPGTQVHSNPDTERMMTAAGSGVTALQVEWVGGNAGDEFMRWLRGNIRIRYGGNVQTALGQ